MAKGQCHWLRARLLDSGQAQGPKPKDWAEHYDYDYVAEVQCQIAKSQGR